MVGAAKPHITDADRRSAWARVAFCNFVVRALDDRSAESRPTQIDWQQSARVFPAVLEALRPRAALVLDSPSGTLLSHAGPCLDAAGVKVIRLAHPSMIPAPRREVRAEAWRTVLDAAR